MSSSVRSADSAERLPIVLTPRLVQVQRADWWVSAALCACYLCLAAANAQLCQTIAADKAYSVIQKIRLVGLHVFAVIFSLLMMFVETKLSICEQFVRALTRHLFVRIFVATVIVVMTLSERHVRLLSFGVGSVMLLGVLLFVQLVLRCVCFAEFEVLLHGRSSESLALTHAAQYGAIRTRAEPKRKSHSGEQKFRENSSNQNSRQNTPQPEVHPTSDLPSWAVEPRSLYTIEAVEFSDDDDNEAPSGSHRYYQHPNSRSDDDLPEWARD